MSDEQERTCEEETEDEKLAQKVADGQAKYDKFAESHRHVDDVLQVYGVDFKPASAHEAQLTESILYKVLRDTAEKDQPTEPTRTGICIMASAPTLPPENKSSPPIDIPMNSGTREGRKCNYRDPEDSDSEDIPDAPPPPQEEQLIFVESDEEPMPDLTPVPSAELNHLYTQETYNGFDPVGRGGSRAWGTLSNDEVRRPGFPKFVPGLGYDCGGYYAHVAIDPVAKMIYSHMTLYTPPIVLTTPPNESPETTAQEQPK